LSTFNSFVFFIFEALKTKLFLLLFLFLSFVVKAQQVINIESRQYDTQDTLWHGNIELNFNLIQNQNQIINAGNKINLLKNQDINSYLFINEFNLVRANANNLALNAYQHLRYKRAIKPYLSGEAFAQTQFNEQIGLKFRGLLGAGPRLRILYADSMKVFTGAMWMYEYEKTTDELVNNVKNRMSFYLSFLYFKEKHFNFDLVCYYQPDLIDFGDFRLLTELKAEWRITQKLSFRFGLIQNYNSLPAKGFPNNTLNVRNAFGYRF
jgi:hypothetical protein